MRTQKSKTLVWVDSPTSQHSHRHGHSSSATVYIRMRRVRILVCFMGGRSDILVSKLVFKFNYGDPHRAAITVIDLETGSRAACKS